MILFRLLDRIKKYKTNVLFISILFQEINVLISAVRYFFNEPIESY